ncbi:MAG: hypothetical protein M1546_12650 [Chloroflexi bacterium]|nr:hypothetical protein [Chloroflexota bacterium]
MDGELDGQTTPRLAQIARAFEEAGFGVSISPNMDAWLKTHIALVSPIANALYLAGGDNYRLARTRDGLVLLVRAVREGLRVLRALDVPITPAKFRVLAWIPEPLLVLWMQRGMATPRAELAMARHANAARDEMKQLADEFQVLARRSGSSVPAIDRLYTFIDSQAPVLSEGSAQLSLDWRSVLVGVGVLAGIAVLVAALWPRRK